MCARASVCVCEGGRERRGEGENLEFTDRIVNKCINEDAKYKTSGLTDKFLKSIEGDRIKIVAHFKGRDPARLRCGYNKGGATNRNRQTHVLYLCACIRDGQREVDQAKGRGKGT